MTISANPSAPSLIYRFIGQPKGLAGLGLDIGIGAFAIFGFAPIFFWPAFVTSAILLVWRIDGAQHATKPAQTAMFRGYGYGLGFFAASLYWTANAFLVDADRYALFMPPLIGALIAGMAIFHALATRIAFAFWQRRNARTIILAIAFTLTDYARGHIWVGLPWNLAGSIWEAGGPISQSAALFGLYGLTALTYFVAFAPAALLDVSGRAERDHRAGGPLIIGAVIFGVLWGWGYQRLQGANNDQPETPTIIRIVGSGFSQAAKLQEGRQDELLRVMLEGSGDAAQSRARIVIWPEGALHSFVLERPDIVEAIGQRLGSRTLILGTARRELLDDGTTRYYNSAISFVSDPRIGIRPDSIYDKVKLVPFGEYIPGGPFLSKLISQLGLPSLEWFEGGFTPGATPAVSQIAGAPPAAILVCFEALFPHFVPRGADRAQWLINISEDAWFGNSWGPAQHYNQARYRAIEEGLPLARAASGGVSAIIDAYGQPGAELGPVGGFLEAALPASISAVVYSRFGDVLLAGLLAALTLLVLAFSARSR